MLGRELSSYWLYKYQNNVKRTKFKDNNYYQTIAKLLWNLFFLFNLGIEYDENDHILMIKIKMNDKKNIILDFDFSVIIRNLVQ